VRQDSKGSFGALSNFRQNGIADVDDIDVFRSYGVGRRLDRHGQAAGVIGIDTGIVEQA
jgi:hypothetical protein